MKELRDAKRAARIAAARTRARLHACSPGAARQAAAHALETIGALRGRQWVAAYLPMRTELDPLPAMLALYGLGYGICAPVVIARGEPLRFRAWVPGARATRGALGERAPVEGDWVEPDVVLAPVLAFDAEGWRLGYGGGFYDRTLTDLRARRDIVAFGFAYAAQQVPAVVHGPGDARLDGVVTEAGLIAVAGATPHP